jgi:hypothetical protein
MSRRISGSTGGMLVPALKAELSLLHGFTAAGANHHCGCPAAEFFLRSSNRTLHFIGRSAPHFGHLPPPAFVVSSSSFGLKKLFTSIAGGAASDVGACSVRVLWSRAGRNFSRIQSISRNIYN